MYRNGRALQPWEDESSADRIIGNLYLSDADTAIDTQYVSNLGIKCIVTIGRELKCPLPQIDYHYISLDDHPDEKISEHFETVNNFIYSNITAGKKVLVHCRAGISRSATLIIAYLMARFDMPFTFALAYTRRRRSVVNPNLGFIQQLKEYNEQLNKLRGDKVPLYIELGIDSIAFPESDKDRETV
jgi:hypothetical protein